MNHSESASQPADVTALGQENSYQMSRTEYGFILFDLILIANAFVLNSAALFVFIKSKTTISNSGIKILIVTEMVLCLSRVVTGSLFLLETDYTVRNYFFTVCDAWVCTRNWWVAVITMCRCIAIFKPLRANHILTCRRQVLAYALILAPSAIISSVRHPCLADSEESKPGYCEYKFIIFIYQSGIPVPTVAVTSVIMVVYLVASPKTIITRQLFYVRRATRTVLALAITFAILESPALILACLDTAEVDHPSYLNTFSNLCISLDSTANFVIFLAITRNFKRSLHALMCRQNSAMQDPILRQRMRSLSNNTPSGGSAGAISRQGIVTNSTSVHRGRSLRSSYDNNVIIIRRES